MTDDEEEMLERISNRISESLLKEPNWRAHGAELVELLDRSDMFTLPEGENPKAWCRSLFETPAVWRLAATAIKMELNVEDITRPIDLVMLLLPSDHHLD